MIRENPSLKDHLTEMEVQIVEKIQRGEL